MFGQTYRHANRTNFSSTDVYGLDMLSKDQSTGGWGGGSQLCPLLAGFRQSLQVTSDIAVDAIGRPDS
jgi:hypothetical protein